MSDLISREAALEKAGWVNLYGGNKSAHVVFSRDIHQLPAVDAVPVVRCKDCKWYEPLCDFGFNEETGRRDHSKIVEKPYGECHGQDFVFTEDGYLRVGQDDFCSYGERREENELVER